MCLIAFAYRQHPRYPLVLIANRDEFYRRPTRDAHFWPEDPGLLAGRDLEQGGTWLGINRSGRLAAVTNVRDGQPPTENLRSRGELTRNFLLGSASCAEYLAALAGEAHRYGGFNLLLGDARGLYFFSNRDRQPLRPLAPGLYGLSNASLDTPWPKVRLIKTQLAAALEQPRLEARTLLPLLHDRHRPEDRQLPDTGVGLSLERLLAPCFIQGDAYGTRASTVLLLDQSHRVTFMEQNYDATGATNRQCHRLRLKTAETGSLGPA